MNLWWLIFRRSDWEQLYLKPCLTKTTQHWHVEGNQNLLIGIVYMSLAVFCMITYIPFLVVMKRKEFFQYPCYKFMFLVGVLDVVAVFCDGVVVGYQSVTGSFYCTNPTLWFVLNSCGSYCWYGVTLSCVLLAMNRFLEMCWPSAAKVMFGERWIYLWMALPILCMVFYMCFGVAFIYSTKRYIYYTDPFAETEFGGNVVFFPPLVHFLHCFMVLIVLAAVYTSMAIVIKVKSILYPNTAMSKRQKIMTLQALCICVEMFISTSAYIYSSFFPLPNPIEIFASICLIGVHGDTPIVYLCLNPSLKKAVLKLVSYSTKHHTVESIRILKTSAVESSHVTKEKGKPKPHT